MKTVSKKWLFSIAMVLIVVSGIILTYATMVTEAAQTEESLYKRTGDVSMNAGASLILGMNISLDNDQLSEIVKEATKEVVTDESQEDAKSLLVMANVEEYLSVRKEPTTEAEEVGRLYQSCGGSILERVEGWTKIRSGDVIGWASDEYLYFDQEAVIYAAKVSAEIVVSDVDGLRVRASASTSAEVSGVLTLGDALVLVMRTGDWYCVEYGDTVGYVLAEYVHQDFSMDTGETIEAIQERERRAEFERLNKPKDAFAATDAEVALLAALIQCEAGGESYEGKIAVASVVLNRVRSSRFPSTISEVIYSPNQFTPATNGKVDQLLAAGGANSSCIKAAEEVLGGRCNIGNYLYFRRKGNTNGYIIGNHVFY